MSFASHTGRTLPDPAEPLAREFVAPVHALVASQAQQAPGRLAIVDPTGQLTYGAVEAASNRLARWLLRRSVTRGARVAILARRSAILPVALLGALKSGAAFAILDPSYPQVRLADYVRTLRPRALLALGAGDVPDAVGAAIEEAGCEARLTLPERTDALPGILAETDSAPVDVEVGPEDPAYVSFTSGTTGRPKGITGLHRPLPHFLAWHQRTFRFGADDRFSMLSGLAHDPLLRDIFTPLTLGASLHVPAGEALRAPEALRAFLRDQRITAIHLTPSLALVVAHAYGGTAEPLPDVRHAFFAGEPLKPATLRQFRKVAPAATCVNFYGATETPQAMGFFVVPADFGAEEAVPIGRGIDDVQLLVIADGKRLAPPGELGEVFVRTPYLTQGYLGDEALTADRYRVNPFTNDPQDRLYRTGDLGRYRPDGLVEFAGRADNQVKVRGFRVELEEVETTLARHPDVHQAVVVLHAGATGDERLVAYAQTTAAPEELRAFVASKLPDYMVPSDVVRVDRFALTPAGKIDRRALPDPDQAVKTVRVAPRDETERKLAKVWEDVLGRAVGIHDDFFDLGGHSLLALSLLTAVEQVFGRQLPVSTMLTAGTVVQMAQLLRAAEDGGRKSLLVALQPKGSRTPVYWLPGGGGLSVMAFRNVSLRLGADQPVYGVEADLDLKRAPKDLEGLARSYVEEIRAFQPRGPYHLLGFSLGSYVAYEMGVQLRRLGEEVGLLVVFDTATPATSTPLGRMRVLSQRASYRLARMREQSAAELWSWARMFASARIAAARDALNRKVFGLKERFQPQRPIDSQAKLFDYVLQQNRIAVYDYAQRPLPRYPGRLTVVLAEATSMSAVSDDVDPRLGWRETADLGIEVHRVPGNHLSMLEPPFADALAAVLRDCLERAHRDAAARSAPAQVAKGA